MIDTLGLPLEEAVRRLEEDGCSVTCELVRCRKDVPGTALRVIRQRAENAHTVCLSYAAFLIPEHANP